MSSHTGGLDYVNTNGVSTRLSPAQDCNILGIAFSGVDESMRRDRNNKIIKRVEGWTERKQIKV